VADYLFSVSIRRLYVVILSRSCLQGSEFLSGNVFWSLLQEVPLACYNRKFYMNSYYCGLIWKRYLWILCGGYTCRCYVKSINLAAYIGLMQRRFLESIYRLNLEAPNEAFY